MRACCKNRKGFQQVSFSSQDLGIAAFIPMDYLSGASTIILRNLLAAPTDNRAFAAFVDRFQPRIKDACCRRFGIQDADADDLTASMLLGFYERETFRTFVYRSKPAFRSWLNMVIRNAFLTFRRGKERRPDGWNLGDADAEQSLEHVCAGLADDVDALCEDDLTLGQTALQTVRDKVGDQTFQAFVSQHFDGEKGTEVARRLGISPEAAWKAKSRVAQMLREEFNRLQAVQIDRASAPQQPETMTSQLDK
jgi:RNA polymerase sigma factor (sigma-70 family)